MKKTRLLVFLSLFASSLATNAFGQAGQWAAALRVGPSIPTNKSTVGIFDTVDGDTNPFPINLRTGPMVSGKVSYGANDIFSLGLEVEWDTHKIPTKTVVDGLSETFDAGGRLRTVSILPFVEIRPVKFGSLSPYLSLGVGANINSVGSKTSQVKSFRAENNFGVKVGGGIDYFITQNLALNSEVGWKYNRGDVRIAGNDSFPDPVNGSDRMNASAVSVLFGVRYFFSK
jgi:opacity protein-like surface antigen